MNMGLRFARQDETLLRLLAERVRSGELPNHHANLFEYAANAAHTGEPLVVECETPGEVTMIADGFTMFGVRRPSVESYT